MKTTLRLSLIMLLCIVVCLFVVPAAYAEEVLSLFLDAQGIIIPRGAVFHKVPRIRVHHIDAEIVRRQRLGHPALRHLMQFVFHVHVFLSLYY